MRERQTLPSLNHLFFHSVDNFRRKCFLSISLPDGSLTWSTDRFYRDVLALRRFLMVESGLAEGDRVAIFCENRPEWSISDFAILLARMIVVPVYADLQLPQVQQLIAHSGTRAVIVSGRERCEIVGRLAAECPQLRCVIVIGEGAESCARATRFSAITAAGAAVSKADELQARTEALSVDPETIASIVYTSGTTGLPKGVMLSHRNVMFDLEQCLERLRFRTVKQALSILPLSHAFERLMCYGYFRVGVCVAYGDPHDLKTLLRRHKPAVLGCVPRVLEKVQDAIDVQVRAQPEWKQKIFRWALRTGLAATSRDASRPRVPLSMRTAYRIANILVFAKIRRQLGGIRYLVCGGAWLNPAVENFFRALGVIVLQGYGLTETAPVTTLNSIRAERTGSVGRALGGVEICISSTGEVLVRGANVMKGYFRDPEATAGAFDGDWFRTGDIGALDEEGNLRIIGRLKEMIVLSTGKKVCPSVTEEALLHSPFIQAVFAVGDERRFLAALIIPRRAAVEAFAAERNLAAGTFDELLRLPGVQYVFHQELAARQQHLAQFERVKRFFFVTEEILLDPELVTPTQKVRRSILERRYAEAMNTMYAQGESERPELFVSPGLSE